MHLHTLLYVTIFTMYLFRERKKLWLSVGGWSPVSSPVPPGKSPFSVLEIIISNTEMGEFFCFLFFFFKAIYFISQMSYFSHPRETTLLQLLVWHNFSFFYYICVHPTQDLGIFCRFKNWIHRTAHITHISFCNWSLFLPFLGSLISSQGSFYAFVSTPGRQFMERLWQFLLYKALNLSLG